CTLISSSPLAPRPLAGALSLFESGSSLRRRSSPFGASTNSSKGVSSEAPGREFFSTASSLTAGAGPSSRRGSLQINGRGAKAVSLGPPALRTPSGATFRSSFPQYSSLGDSRGVTTTTDDGSLGPCRVVFSDF